MNYKIAQLEEMLRQELDPKTSGYGAHLTHWSGNAKPINIDAKAIQALIDHYNTRLDPDTQRIKDDEEDRRRLPRRGSYRSCHHRAGRIVTGKQIGRAHV